MREHFVTGLDFTHDYEKRDLEYRKDSLLKFISIMVHIKRTSEGFLHSLRL